MNLNLGLPVLRLPLQLMSAVGGNAAAQLLLPQSAPPPSLQLTLPLGPRLRLSCCGRTAATLVSNSSETTLSLLC